MITLGSITIDWFKSYESSRRLTEDAEYTLRLFTQEEWCQQIPYSVKLDTLKLSVAQSYDVWLNWVETGDWGIIYERL